MNVEWDVRGRRLSTDRPIVMGILNVTPDSFSDGGRFFSSRAAALDHVGIMLDAGADIIDIGGESTRPGASPVSSEDELGRVLPLIETIAQRHPNVVLSVDTVKSSVARAALEAGAHIVNDVSALRLDPEVGAVCASAHAGLVLMHSRGTVGDMATYAHSHYDDTVDEVLAELQVGIEAARAMGVAKERIALDPGIGFAKKGEHSLAILAGLPRLAACGYPVMVGVSRKRFIGDITGITDAGARLSGTMGANVASLALGARIFRVHDVREARESLDVAWEILRRTR